MRAHGASAYSRTGEQPEGANGVPPTRTGGKMPSPVFGAHQQGPGTSRVAAARGAFKWRWMWAILGEGRVRLPY
eukprot:4086307-Prymnesium_polylepis.1